jgi:hypothetical protein
MYGVFLVCLIVFSIGLYRHLRSLGIGAAGGATFRDHGAARRSSHSCSDAFFGGVTPDGRT